MKRTPVAEGCREELGAPSWDKCWEPATYLLWGKLFPTNALGPRCEMHATKHIGASNMPPHGWAVLDMRGLYRER